VRHRRFNPFALEYKFVRKDAQEWWRWLTRESGADSWNVWYEREAGSQYAQANVGARLWRLIRLSRLLLLAVLFLHHGTNADPVRLAVVGGIAVATIFGMQAVYWATSVCPVRTQAEGASGWSCHHPTRRVLQTVVYVAAVGAVLVLNGIMSPDGLPGSRTMDLYVAYCVLLWWASRVFNIISLRICADGVRAVHKVRRDACGGRAGERGWRGGQAGAPRQQPLHVAAILGADL